MVAVIGIVNVKASFRHNPYTIFFFNKNSKIKLSFSLLFLSYILFVWLVGVNKGGASLLLGIILVGLYLIEICDLVRLKFVHVSQV